MRLYHGTTEAVARAALAQGLAPRALTRAKGNWDKHPSNPHAVYLTTAYAGYFAACASDDGNKCPDPERIRQAQCILAERGGIELLAGAASATRRTPWSERHDAAPADSAETSGVAGA